MKREIVVSLSLKIINSYTQTLTLKFSEDLFLFCVPSASDVYLLEVTRVRGTSTNSVVGIYTILW